MRRPTKKSSAPVDGDQHVLAGSLLVLYNEREQATARLCLLLEPISIYFLELATILSAILVVDAV
jgi:hypothetical protein